MDENLVAPPADLNIGVCEGQVKVCNGPTGFGEPDYTLINTYEAGPNEATCDGLDNDCDGEIDDGIQLNLAENQRGVCEGMTKVCAGVLGQIEPNYANAPNHEAVEVSCDGLDNDCDGIVDEGPTGEPLTGALADNQLGVCLGAVKICQEGAFQEPDYTQIAGYNADDLPGDLLDTNCDGIIGTLDRAVFVSLAGLASNSGLTPDRPLPTLSQAFFAMDQNLGRDHIYVQQGVYNTDSTLTVPNGAKIFGGFADDFQSRVASSFNTHLNSTASTVFSVENLTRATRFDDVRIAATGSRALNDPTVGLKVRNSDDHLSLNGITPAVGAGGIGSSGRSGIMVVWARPAVARRAVAQVAVGGADLHGFQPAVRMGRMAAALGNGVLAVLV